MRCEHDTKSLTDLAAGTLSPEQETELRAHLADCTGCRAALEEQRELFAAIDRGVAASVAGKPSAEFVARVCARVEAERPAPIPWFVSIPRRWLPVAATALAGVALLAVWVSRRPPARPASREVLSAAQHPALAPNTAPAVGVMRTTPSGSAAAAQQLAVARGQRRERTGRRAPAGEPKRGALFPLVEREAVLRLYAAVWSGQADATTLVARPVSIELRELRVAPLEVRALEVEGESPAPPKNETP